MLIPTADRRFELAVELAVTRPSFADPNEAQALVRAAHERCPYSKATRGNIDVTLTVKRPRHRDPDSGGGVIRLGLA